VGKLMFNPSGTDAEKLEKWREVGEDLVENQIDTERAGADAFRQMNCDWPALIRSWQKQPHTNQRLINLDYPQGLRAVEYEAGLFRVWFGMEMIADVGRIDGAEATQ